ncbi:hypothetical protein SAMN05428997_101281 [Bosea sp. CRIB-10]|nr:hypothetical protein SAMN05428997_101281 [Bosea sp. CRIB-10]
MQECHAGNEAVPAGPFRASMLTYRSPGFAKFARYRLSTVGAAFACTRDHGRWWPRFLSASM